jgi:adenylate cyclase
LADRTRFGGASPSAEAARISLREAARRAGVSESTLKRWAAERVVPVRSGRWTPAAAAQARVVARMRDRGYSLREIRAAVRDGRLAFGYVEDLLPSPERGRSRREAAELLGLEDELVERIMTLLGVPVANADRLSDDDLEAMRTLKQVLDSGFPLVALLQLIRVYAQSMRRIAEAEVRLFHLYVHEPLIEDGLPPLEMAEEMSGLAERLFPAMAPVTDYVHKRYLRHYLEQDVIGHMESDLGIDRKAEGNVSMAFCFVDLTGFTRYMEEEGDQEALDLVERFVETVEATLPAEATIVKTIGDEVMAVSPDPATLADWAVGFLDLFRERPRPRTGLHFGSAVYRDGDYYGRDVNLTHRIVARAMAGEVLVTSSLVDEIGSSELLAFEPIGAVDLKGFPEPTELFIAARPPGSRPRASS